MTRVVFMGTPDFAVPSLAALLQAGYDVMGVLTQQDRRAGRGRRMSESPVKQHARAAGLTIQQPRSLRCAEAQADLARLAPDVIVVAAYGLILPQTVLEMPRSGCVNVHASLLPRHRGAAPIAAAILKGDAETGISVMLMDAGLDTGPILAQATLPITPQDTTATLTGKLADLGAQLLIDTLPRWLDDQLVPQPQPTAGATYAPRINKQEGKIDWREPAAQIARRVRAYQPWPSAFTTWQDKRLKISRSWADETAFAGEPGQVIADSSGAVGVVTGGGTLWLEEIQLEGKRPMPAHAFVRGAPGFVGSILG